jgi:NADPH-dependent glutamate synthase beta subunit-like oxidoreductase
MNPHVVAVFGGAVSGAEAASQLAAQGIRTIVFDQHALPYGKIEDGLPKWHAKLRDKEEANINDKLDHPLITFVPNTKLGRDLDFRDVLDNWGFSAVLLATGAWRDRPLPIPGVDEFVGKGLYYQNPFIHWFNHCHEPGYQGARLRVADGALVIGGGLASIDVAKALMMETVRRKLAERNVLVHMFDLERGIANVLAAHQLSIEDLGLAGCTLVYRRRIQDMPLFPGDTDTPEKMAKAEAVREKVLRTAQARFLFNVLPCTVPVDKIIEDGRLQGLVLRSTRVADGKVMEIRGSEQAFRTSLVISSIGSVPDPLPGVPMKGQTFAVETDACCRIRGFHNVFALGNAVTGRGNIRESMEHGRAVSTAIARNYLAAPEAYVGSQFREQAAAAADATQRFVKDSLTGLPPISAAQAAHIFEKVAARHQAVGYDGNFRKWVADHLPVRLEQLLGFRD